MVYTSIKNLEGLESDSPDYGSGINDADKLLEAYPGSYLQIGLCMVGELSNTYSGMNDGNIEKLGRWLNRIGGPVFLRIGYECDGPHNSYGPADYVKAYRHIVDRLRMEGVTNAAFVWHATCPYSNPDLAGFYPGDSYADWVGISYFNQPENMITPVLDFAKARQKPVMVAEGTPRGIGSGKGRDSWKKWYGKFFEFLDRNDIKAVSYINSDWDAQKMWKSGGWKDARVEADEYVLKHWIAEIIGRQVYQIYPFIFGIFRRDVPLTISTILFSLLPRSRYSAFPVWIFQNRLWLAGRPFYSLSGFPRRALY